VVSCATCPAAVTVEAAIRNVTRRPQTLRPRGTFGEHAVRFPRRTIPAGATKLVRARVRVRKPHLWSPADPFLYRVRVQAGEARHSLRTGIRDVRVADGRLLLNFAPVSLRGVGFHEEAAGKGLAISNADREWLVNETRALGGTLMRTHYPPHPHLHELADRLGVLLWSEIPVYSMKNGILGEPEVRDAAAALLRENIEVNGNHPSVIVWSVANELSADAGPAQAAYFAKAAREIERLDPARLLGYAFAGYPSVGCQAEYAPLDVLGVNDYFGWYPGPDGELFDRENLSPYLDQLRACYPAQALMVTEFGAEANRDGPVEDKKYAQADTDVRLETAELMVSIDRATGSPCLPTMVIMPLTHGFEAGDRVKRECGDP
jgi:beta-glucuronidase